MSAAQPLSEPRYRPGWIVRLDPHASDPHAGEEVRIKAPRPHDGPVCYLAHLHGDHPNHDFYVAEKHIVEVLDTSGEVALGQHVVNTAARHLDTTPPLPAPHEKVLPEPVDPAPRRALIRLHPQAIQPKEEPMAEFRKLDAPTAGAGVAQLHTLPDPITKADFIWNLIQENHWSQVQAATHFNMALAQLNRYTRLARAPEDLRAAVREGRLGIDKALREAAARNRAQHYQPDAAPGPAAPSINDDPTEEARALVSVHLAEEISWLEEDLAAVKEELSATRQALMDNETDNIILQTTNSHLARRVAELTQERNDLARQLHEALAARQTITINGGSVTITSKE